jgi:hypothetical protein
VPYDEGVAAAAWERLTDFFKKHLAEGACVACVRQQQLLLVFG